jgi:hypothetical protein
MSSLTANKVHKGIHKQCSASSEPRRDRHQWINRTKWRFALAVTCLCLMVIVAHVKFQTTLNGRYQFNAESLVVDLPAITDTAPEPSSANTKPKRSVLPNAVALHAWIDDVSKKGSRPKLTVDTPVRSVANTVASTTTPPISTSPPTTHPPLILSPQSAVDETSSTNWLGSLIPAIQPACESWQAQSGSKRTCQELKALSPDLSASDSTQINGDGDYHVASDDEVGNERVRERALKSVSGRINRFNLPWTQHVLGDYDKSRRIDDGLDGSELPYCVSHTMRNISSYNVTKCDILNTSFDVASKRCEAIGARLCTLDEVQYASLNPFEAIQTCAGQVKSRFGKWPRVWTSTRCGEGMAYARSMVRTGRPRCFRRSYRAPTMHMCCGDNFGAETCVAKAAIERQKVGPEPTCPAGNDAYSCTFIYQLRNYLYFLLFTVKFPILTA